MFALYCKFILALALSDLNVYSAMPAAFSVYLTKFLNSTSFFQFQKAFYWCLNDIVFIFKKLSSNSTYSVSTDAYPSSSESSSELLEFFASLCFSVIVAKVCVRQRVWGIVGNEGAAGGMGSQQEKTFHGQTRVEAGAGKICLEKKRCPGQGSITLQIQAFPQRGRISRSLSSI